MMEIGEMGDEREQGACEAPRGKRRRTKALLCAVGAVLLLASPFLVIGVGRIMEAWRQADCSANPKAVGLLLRLFAMESDGGMWPQLSSEAGRLMFENDMAAPGKKLWPDFVDHPGLLICPSERDPSVLALFESDDPDQILNDHNFFYLGYVVRSDKEMQAFAAAYRDRIKAGRPFDEDLDVPKESTEAGDGVLRRIRDGIERWYSDPGGDLSMKASIPVLVERPENHDPPGGNVLYLDGHVEYHRHPGKFPMTETTVGLLWELDALGS